MSTQHQSDTVIEDDAGSQKIEPVREVRVQALTHTEHPSPAAGPSFSHHFRSLFVSLEFYPNSVTIEYQNWHNSDVQCKALAVPPPPACELSEERPVMAEPVKDGRLILHAIIPKDYPGGKEGFSSTSAKFLRSEQTFGIAHIYFGEDDIAAYLKMVSESFKEQSKSSSRSKNKEPKGKAIKWKNPATAFGCRYVWAHDLATPHLLYFRIRPTWVDLTALAVVDTTHDGYRNELGNSKVRYSHPFCLSFFIHKLACIRNDLCNLPFLKFISVSFLRITSFFSNSPARSSPKSQASSLTQHKLGGGTLFKRTNGGDTSHSLQQLPSLSQSLQPPKM
jgi:hypothetical protein